MSASEMKKDSIEEAMAVIRNFVKETTRETAGTGEIARALRHYFVLNEIKEHIVRERAGEDALF